MGVEPLSQDGSRDDGDDGSAGASVSGPPDSPVSHVLVPRGALTLHHVDGARLFAVRAATAMAVPAVALAAAGQARLAVFTMLGAFTTSFGHNLPYRRRAWALALVAVATTACVAGGSALAAAVDPQAGGTGALVVVLATALVAGLAKLGCEAARLPGLGAVLLLFSFAVAANGSPSAAQIPQQTWLAALGAAVAWLLSMTGWLIHPMRPQRLALASAFRALGDLLGSRDAAVDPPGRARHRATVAVLEAYRSIGVAPLTDARQARRGDVCVQLADLAWTELVRSIRKEPREPEALVADLGRQADLLADRRQRDVVVVSGLTRWIASGNRAAEATVPGAGTGPDSGKDSGSVHLRRAVITVPALRMTLGTAAAGGLALALGLGHGYWAAISAAAVLHSVNLRSTAQRSLQRTLGTTTGLLLALAVLAAHPAPVTLVLTIVALEFLLEYVVARNYALGVVFLTPLALLLSELASPSPAEHLALERGLGSLLGIAVGLLCALFVGHDRAARRVERALSACRTATAQAQAQLDTGLSGPQAADVQLRLSAAVVELHAAHDTAAGELWQAGVDPALVAATEQGAYRLLDRLLHAAGPTARPEDG